MLIKTKAQLHEAISLQEKKVAVSREMLIEQYQQTKEGLKPANLVKNTFAHVTGNSDLTKNLLKAGLGIGAALVTKRMFVGAGSSLVGKALGLAMNLGVVNAIAGPLKSKGLKLLQRFRHSSNGKHH